MEQNYVIVYDTFHLSYLWVIFFKGYVSQLGWVEAKLRDISLGCSSNSLNVGEWLFSYNNNKVDEDTSPLVRILLH